MIRSNLTRIVGAVQGSYYTLVERNHSKLPNGAGLGFSNFTRHSTVAVYLTMRLLVNALCLFVFSICYGKYIC
jgi:hypothetical protein